MSAGLAVTGRKANGLARAAAKRKHGRRVPPCPSGQLAQGRALTAWGPQAAIARRGFLFLKMKGSYLSLKAPE
jgi:hypothetical protein